MGVKFFFSKPPEHIQTYFDSFCSILTVSSFIFKARQLFLAGWFR